MCYNNVVRLSCWHVANTCFTLLYCFHLHVLFFFNWFQMWVLRLLLLLFLLLLLLLIGAVWSRWVVVVDRCCVVTMRCSMSCVNRSVRGTAWWYLVSSTRTLRSSLRIFSIIQRFETTENLSFSQKVAQFHYIFVIRTGQQMKNWIFLLHSLYIFGVCLEFLDLLVRIG